MGELYYLICLKIKTSRWNVTQPRWNVMRPRWNMIWRGTQITGTKSKAEAAASRAAELTWGKGGEGAQGGRLCLNLGFEVEPAGPARAGTWDQE